MARHFRHRSFNNQHNRLQRQVAAIREKEQEVKVIEKKKSFGKLAAFGSAFMLFAAVFTYFIY